MNEKTQIEKKVQLYFDSMYESDPQKVEEVFHPNAKITGFMQEKLFEQSVEDFAKFVASQQPSAKEKEEPKDLEILSIEIAGDTAVALVRDKYIGLSFLDSLSFLKIENNWVIYNKLFHVET
ncbi:MAG: nuclear transport factor 2 family protein [Gammaproteobacteria bacterium]|nr:MAG: nuclear transport factor 2 family protein [Gammaproteobacteria bacterium]